MKTSLTRRNFLKAGTASTLGVGTLTGAVGSVTAAETVTLSGTVTAENGVEIRNDEINASGHDTYKHTRTDDDGYFELVVPKNAEYRVGFYKADSRSDLEGTKDGVPHIYHFGRHIVTDENKNLGELTLPEAHIVDLRVLKPNGEPLMGAQPDYRHSGWGANPGRLSLNTDGYTVIEGATFTGLELVEHATAEVDPPTGDEYEDRTYKKQVAVDGPTEIVATIDASGATWEVNQGESDKSETTTTTTTSKTTTATTTSQQESTSPPSTQTQTTQADSNPTAAAPTPTTTQTGNETATQPERGFFSNGADAEDMEMLNDPFTLTVGGFVLSAAGIAHQMLRGY